MSDLFQVAGTVS